MHTAMNMINLKSSNNGVYISKHYWHKEIISIETSLTNTYPKTLY